MGSASDLISRIDSLLDDLQFLADAVDHKVDSQTNWFVFVLSNYKIFLVSVTKLGDHPIVGPFLDELQDLVCQLEVFHSIRLSFSDPDYAQHIEIPGVLGLERLIKSLEKQSGQLCDILLDPSMQSNTFTSVEIADMLASVMKNLFLFHNLGYRPRVEILEEPIKALEEHILFLQNLILFVSKAADSKADQHLLNHVEAVSIMAAHLLNCLAQNVSDQSFSQDLISDLSELIQYIKPADPKVHQTYTEILRTSKSQRSLLAPADRDVYQEHNHSKRFLDSLRSILLEMLQMNTHGVVSIKDPLQELYHGLGSLATRVSHQPNTFDSNAKDHFFDVVCDAGILICSLYQTHLQLDPDLQDLLEAIRLILTEFEEKSAPEPKFNKVPTTAPLSSVDFVLEKVQDLTGSEIETNTRSHAHAIKENLVTLRSLLGNIVELREEQEEFQTLRDHILELVYRAEHLIDYLVVGDLSDSFSSSFDFFMKDIMNIHLEFDVPKIEVKTKGVNTIHQHVPSQRTLLFENEVVGYLDEAKSIKNQLMRGSKKLCAVPIVGMPGQGKTTFAAKIYNDPSVSCHFPIFAQTVVSQTVDKRRVLLDLLSQIAPDKCSRIISYNDLVQEVWRSLKGQTYLIFLDDVWEAEAWNTLKQAFPDDHTASRIMLTSRHHEVVPGTEPYELRPFNEEESMVLLQRKLFDGSGRPTELDDIGKKIAQICKGLPLTILIVAGILSTTEQEGWKKILGGLGSGIFSSTEQCRNTLELSYKHLPEHLRPCLLYLGTFPEDKEVFVRRLVRLWIAEGFVRKDGKKRIEDIAEGYLKDLIGRSLLMAVKEKSIGGLKSCRIHDMLHEFCLQKAKDERFFSFTECNDEVLEFHEPQYRRRLCINSDPKHIIRFNNYFSYVRSLNFNYCKQQVLPNLSSMFGLCKLLRVLDLEQINLGSFPSEIGLLVQLAFLAVRGSMRDIPLWIGNLSSLECFIINHLRIDKMLALPECVWKLQKLRHLQMKGQGGIFLIENLDNSSDLCELDWLSGVAIHYPCDVEQLLKKFPNIRKLKCSLLKSADMINNHVTIVVPDFLRHLESLSISLSFDGIIHSEFSLPANLKKLTLSSFPLSSCSLTTISKLPNLEVLKLKDVKFEGNKWETEEEGFSKLRFLQLSSMELISWRASEDQFECLEKLVLLRCGYLKEMPSCLEYSSMLAVIELRYCSNSVHKLVRNLKEALEENRNSELKIVNV